MTGWGTVPWYMYLTNDRFVKKEKGGSFSAAKDYYGFVPLRPEREKQFRKRDFRLTELLELAENNDALYYADTYGVFFNDWYQGIKKARRSRRLYGGLNNNDYLLMSEMKNRDKLVILSSTIHLIIPRLPLRGSRQRNFWDNFHRMDGPVLPQP